MSMQTLKKVLLWGFLLCIVALALYVFLGASGGLNMTIIFLILGLSIAVLIALAVVSVIANNQRKAALQQLALERGLTYTPKIDDIAALLGGVSFEMTNTGHYQRVRNIINGQMHGSAVKIFDLYFMTGTGRNQSNHQQTGVVLAVDEPNLPDFILAPEHLLSKLANALGRKEIDFDEDPDFSKQFLLIGADEAAVRQVFNPVVREWFKNHRGICAEMQLSQLLLYRKEKLLEMDELLKLVEDGAALVNQIKRYSR